MRKRTPMMTHPTLLRGGTQWQIKRTRREVEEEAEKTTTASVFTVKWQSGKKKVIVKRWISSLNFRYGAQHYSLPQSVWLAILSLTFSLLLAYCGTHNSVLPPQFLLFLSLSQLSMHLVRVSDSWQAKRKGELWATYLWAIGKVCAWWWSSGDFINGAAADDVVSMLLLQLMMNSDFPCAGKSISYSCFAAWR